MKKLEELTTDELLADLWETEEGFSGKELYCFEVINEEKLNELVRRAKIADRVELFFDKFAEMTCSQFEKIQKENNEKPPG